MTEEQIDSIAQDLNIGMRCFVHKENKSIVVIPDERMLRDIDDDLWGDVMDEIEDNSHLYIEIEKMLPHDSFEVMSDFVETVSDVKLRRKLESVLSESKPFKKFKYEIDYNSGDYREEWFAFKNQQMKAWVKRQLERNELL